ncbi:hypothetical protein NB704_004172 [Pantoea ananatis]|nr:hypothetical protein [Pantoea ananatis]
MLGADHFAGAPAQRIIMIVRGKPAVRAIAFGGDEPVFGVIGKMLLMQAASSTDQVAPAIIFHKQVLPVMQSIVGNRQRVHCIVVGSQVVRIIISKMRGAVALSGFVVLQQAAFIIVTIDNVAA